MNRTFAVCLILFVVIASRSHAAIRVSINETTVTAEGLTARAGAVFFSVGREPRLAYSSIRRVSQYVSDDDGDGVVALTPLHAPA